MRIFGLILAGGEGRRMGGTDKALLPMAGTSLLANAIARFAPQVEDLALSANGDPARFLGFGLPVLADERPLGPLSGVLAGLIWAEKAGAQALATVPVDGPFLPPDLVPRLCLAADVRQEIGLETPLAQTHSLAAVRPALAASPNGIHPTFALWPTRLRSDLAAFLASGAKPRIRDFAMAHGMATADFAEDLAFANANTPQDLAQLAALAAKGS
jgi:molybdopterin-guanine dinucleotide biosynthesis protein A